jgi:2-hydroxy-3-keto-5-methylthiopentenyl-1-phosphate phosphatase
MALAELPVRTVVVDFDGTVVPQDVSEEILGTFAQPGWWDIDLEFQRGEIGSRACLLQQAALLRGPQAEMLRFAVERYPLDPTFGPFARWAIRSGMAVAVASDGLGFYIEAMFEAAGIEGLAVHTNRTLIENGSSPVVSFPQSHPVCTTCGVCKMSVVQRYRASGPVAFVGEGHTDRYGALYSDLVFAKKHLPEICRSDGVRFVEWTTFDDVRSVLATMRAAPGAVAPERCPGWPSAPGGGGGP